MSALRISLLLLMGLVVTAQVCLPGLHDTRRRSSAMHQIFDAQQQHESAPSAKTQQKLVAANLELTEARRLDRRDLLVMELFLLGVLGASAYAFIRVGKHIDKIPAVS
jgi:hypothetical protein